MKEPESLPQIEKVVLAGREFKMRKPTYERMEALEIVAGKNNEKIYKWDVGIEALKIMLEGDVDQLPKDQLTPGDIMGVIGDFFMKSVDSPISSAELTKRLSELTSPSSERKPG